MRPLTDNMPKSYVLLSSNITPRKGGGVNSKHTWFKSDLALYTSDELYSQQYKYAR
jgi:hypothetical protein